MDETHKESQRLLVGLYDSLLDVYSRADEAGYHRMKVVVAEFALTVERDMDYATAIHLVKTIGQIA